MSLGRNQFLIRFIVARATDDDELVFDVPFNII